MLGFVILRRQRDEGWGAKVIDRLVADLRHAFPEMTGLSARNLRYMRAFSEAYPDRGIVQQLVAQLPWGHIVVLLSAVKKPDEREWYMRETVENGWSRNVPETPLAGATASSGSKLKRTATLRPGNLVASVHGWDRFQLFDIGGWQSTSCGSS